MSLSNAITEELKAAMRAKDKIRLEALRSIKSALLLLKTEKGGGQEPSEAEELKLLQRLQKQRKESLDIYQEQGRSDLAEEEAAQLAVIESFLPAPLSDAELEAYLKNLVVTLDIQGPQDMGKIMGKAAQELAGKADGKRISAKVKEILANH